MAALVVVVAEVLQRQLIFSQFGSISCSSSSIITATVKI
jgi:hypothetical protein